jgi:hypothetical protein
MTGEALRTAWLNSRAANSALIVLMAITFEIEENGGCVMNIAELAKRARLSDNAARIAVRDLEQLGEVSVASRKPGRGGGCTYLVTAEWARNPTRSGGLTAQTPQDLEGSNPTGSGGFSGARKAKAQASRPNPTESGGFENPDDLKGSVVSGKRSKPKVTSAPVRSDVERLCDHLADRMAERGISRPKIGKRWLDAARLMIDVDGRTEQEIHGAIDWSQQHHFWHRNVMSMEKLRSQYDRLLLEAKAEREKQARSRPLRQQETDDLFDAAMRRAEEKEAGIEAH